MDKEEFLKKLEAELKISSNSTHTIRNYLSSNKFLLDFANKTPEEITHEDVKSYLAEKLNNASSMTKILFLSAIKYSFSNILKKDITIDIKRPKKEKKIPSVLSKEEVKSLMYSIQNKKSKLMVSLTYAVGLRVSEMEDLQKQDKKQKEKNQIFLFSSFKGQMTTRNIQKIVSKVAKKVGIEKEVHPHTLRHSFATHLLENGTDIRHIQKLLGHSSLNTTQVYTNISAEQIKKIKSPIDSP